MKEPESNQWRVVRRMVDEFDFAPLWVVEYWTGWWIFKHWKKWKSYYSYTDAYHEYLRIIS